jgi:hypothetical protein
MKKITLYSLITVSLLIPSFNQPAFSAEQEISVFKNNTSFIKKEIYKKNTFKKETDLVIETIPDALFGTIGFTYNNGSLDKIVSENDEFSESTEVSNFNDILQANIGKKVKINLQSNETFEVVISKISGDTLFCKDLKTSGQLIFSISSIKFFNFIDNPESKFNKKVTKRVIKISSSKLPDNIDMLYMQRDLGWLPSYRLVLKDKEEAQITLDGILVNNAEDIDKAKVSLVIGYPNFIYTKYLSPFTSTQDLNSFLSSMNPYSSKQRNYNQFSNIVMQSNSMNEGSIDIPDAENSLSQNEDLYFYKLNGEISLKKGSRAMFELFSDKVKYQDIYEAELETNQNRYYSQNQEQNKNDPTKVWHSVRITNTTKYPFTTAPVMVLKDDNSVLKPVSQDDLNYTSIGSKTKVKLTLSPDILVKNTEKEISRNENVKLIDGYYYNLVTVESKIEIKNSNSKDIKLNISRIIEGDLGESSFKWSNYALNIYNTQNKINKVEWELDLKSKEKKEIKYKYSLYMRR